VFFTVREPPGAGAPLRALRPSLNTPVVAIRELPPGPANALLACHDEAGGLRVTLAVRSTRSGEVVFYGPDDELSGSQGPDLALDAALSLAESMGFLFDDDRFAGAPEEARALWADLTGLEAPPSERDVSAQLPVVPEGPDPDPSAADPGDEPIPGRVALPVPAVSASVSLTKFRVTAGSGLS
jgi:hypothetical protein